MNHRTLVKAVEQEKIDASIQKSLKHRQQVVEGYPLEVSLKVYSFPA